MFKFSSFLILFFSIQLSAQDMQTNSTNSVSGTVLAEPNANPQIPIKTNDNSEKLNSKKSKFESYLLIGTTLNPKTSSRVNFLGATASASDDDNKTISIGLDLTYFFNDNFGLGFVLDSHEYAYSGGGNNDRVLYMGLLPRYKTQLFDKVSFWGGLALGSLQNRLGDTAYVISSSYYIEAKTGTTSALCFSPRVGLDFDTGENVKLRLQLAHSSADLEYDFKVKNYPSYTYIGEGTYKATRTWDTLSIGISWGH